MERSSVLFCLMRACTCVVALIATTPVAAQQVPPASQPTRDANDEAPAANGAQPASAERPSDVEIDLTNPRAAVQSFMAAAEARDYARAARVLDFTSMNIPPDQLVRENLAFKLAEVIRMRPGVDVSLVTDDPEAEDVRLTANGDTEAVELAPDLDGRWRIVVDSVQELESLYARTTADATQRLASELPMAPGAGEATPMSVEGEADRALTLNNPRRTMQTFLTAAAENDYGRAAQTMDFSLLPSPPTEAEQAIMAWKLKEIIDRMQWVDYAKIPTAAEGQQFLFPIGANNQPIAIAPDNDGNWKFTRETVARLDDLYTVWKDRPRVYQSILPIWMRTPIVAGNEGWRLVALCASVLASLLVAQIARWVIRQPAKALQARRPIAAMFFQSLSRSIAPLVLWIGLWLGLKWIVVDDALRDVLDAVLHVLAVVAVAQVLYRLVDVVDVWLREFAGRRKTKLDDMLAPFVRRSLRATVIILALVQIASVLSDQPPASIIAGLGVASIAIGLAAQDTIKNLFGSVMLLADRPFEVGERVVVDGHDGSIEAVGFRSTRIRTLEGHLLTVPNGELANRVIENIGKRPHIRRIMNLGVTYDTSPDKIARAVQIVKQILADHEGMHPDFPPRVFFNEFKDASLNVFAIYWYHPADYWAYCDFSQRVNFEILRRFDEEGIEFAFPTQTLYLTGDPQRPIFTAVTTDSH